MNKSPDESARQPRYSIRMDARSDVIMRAKLEGLAASFLRLRAAVLRQVMRRGLLHG